MDRFAGFSDVPPIASGEVTLATLTIGVPEVVARRLEALGMASGRSVDEPGAPRCGVVRGLARIEKGHCKDLAQNSEHCRNGVFARRLGVGRRLLRPRANGSFGDGFVSRGEQRRV
jgi:hypothetical protein